MMRPADLESLRTGAQGGDAPTNIRGSARPSAARAAAAALLVGVGDERQRLDPKRVGEDIRHLRVVETPRLTAEERRRRARMLVSAGVALVLAVVFGLVYVHVVLAQRQFAIDRLTSQVQGEQATYQNLRLRVAQLGSPQNIISTAEGKLGMVQPGTVSYLTPSRQSSAGSAIPPASGTGSTGSANTAPAGDADWPQVKSQLAGSP